MATYTVHMPPAGAPEQAALERTRFIREAGAALALIFPALWLLFHRLWYALVIYLLIVVVLGILSRTMMSTAPAYLSLIPALYLFLEGRELLRRKLERKGWRFVGVVEAADRQEAEARWFAAHPPSQPIPAPAAVASSTPAATVSPAEQPAPSIGIFGQ